MPALLTTRARAKVNLTLRVLGRREDGYHEIESLVAFAAIGDGLSLDPSAQPGLTISGPFAARLAAQDNLVLRAAEALAQARPGLRSGAFHLVKRLPLASGIGGGSADAAAALRLLSRLNRIAEDDPVLRDVAVRIGADVPVCLASRPRVMRGIGERLDAPLHLPPLFALLVNPGVPVETAAVFRALGLEKGAKLGGARAESVPAEDGDIVAALARAGNDLEAPAVGHAPAIGEVLAALRALPGCRFARMSGSGATCFALFDDCRASATAGRALLRERPSWWVRPTLLR